MRSSFLSLVTGIGVFAVCVSAQVTKAVVPVNATSIEGAGIEARLLGGAPGRTQLVIARSMLGSLANKPIRRIVIRRDAHLNSVLPAGMIGGWIELTIRTSWTVVNPRMPSGVFSRNHATTTAVAYQGEYRVIDSPALPRNTRVASMAPNVSAHIVLQTPIAPAASGNLCLEFVHRKHPTKTPPAMWYADAQVVTNEPREFFGRSCIRRGKKDVFAAKASLHTVLGSTLRFSTTGPDASVGFLMVGSSNTQWGRMKLPLDLTGFGAPNCRFYVAQDLMLPVAMRKHPLFGDTSASHPMQLPHLATLAGARIYSQWMFFSPTANLLGLTTTNGVSVAIAPVPVTARVGVVRSANPAAAAGDIQLHHTPVIELRDR